MDNTVIPAASRRPSLWQLVAGGIAAAYGLLLFGLYYRQDAIVLKPPRDLPEPDHPFEEWLEAGEFVALINEVSAPVKGTLLVFHGNASVAQESSYFAHMASAHGYRTILAEYPGFGVRSGKVGIAESAHAGIALARRVLELYPEPLTVVGYSFGAGVAAQVAGHFPYSIRKAVLITPWDSLAEVASRRIKWAPIRRLLRHSMDSTHALQSFRGIIHLVAAEADEVIPVAHARALAAALPDAHYLELPGCGHSEWGARLPETFWHEVFAGHREQATPGKAEPDFLASGPLASPAPALASRAGS